MRSILQFKLVFIDFDLIIDFDHINSIINIKYDSCISVKTIELSKKAEWSPSNRIKHVIRVKIEIHGDNKANAGQIRRIPHEEILTCKEIFIIITKINRLLFESAQFIKIRALEQRMVQNSGKSKFILSFQMHWWQTRIQ